MKSTSAAAAALLLCFGATSYGEFVYASSTDDSRSGVSNSNLANGNGAQDYYLTANKHSFEPPAPFAAQNYAFVILHFTLSDNSTLSIDAASNPEPGTIALFGVGALGLAGFAVKRRRARLVAKRPA